MKKDLSVLQSTYYCYGCIVNTVTYGQESSKERNDWLAILLD